MQIRGWREERRRERQEIEGENDVMECKWGRGEKEKREGERQRKNRKREDEIRKMYTQFVYEYIGGF